MASAPLFVPHARESPVSALVRLAAAACAGGFRYHQAYADPMVVPLESVRMPTPMDELDEFELLAEETRAWARGVSEEQEPPARVPTFPAGSSYKSSSSGVLLPWLSESRPSEFEETDTSLWSFDKLVATVKSVFVDLVRGSWVLCPKATLKSSARAFVTWSGAKYRLVVSFVVLNTFLSPATAKYESIHDMRADVFAKCGGKFDLAYAFHQIRLDDGDSVYAGVIIDNVCFRTTTLSLGMSHSPDIFCQALSVTVSRMRVAALAVTAFVDDIGTRGPSPVGALRVVLCALRIAREDGWGIALKKVFAAPCSQLLFLGLVVDFSEHVLRIPDSKCCKALNLCEVFANPEIGIADRRDALESFLGLWAFLCVAYPPLALCKQSLQEAVHCGDMLAGLSCPGAIAELEYVKWFLVFGAEDLLFRPPVAELVSACLTTDASVDGWGGLAVCDSSSVRLGGTFSRTERSWGSGPRELLACLRMLLDSRVDALLRGRTVRWNCDALAATGPSRKWSSPSADSRFVLSALYQALDDAGVSIVPTWVRRSDGLQPVADALSRLCQLKTAEWSLERGIMEGLWEWCGKWSLDVFADVSFAVASRFCTLMPPGDVLRSDLLPTASQMPMADGWLGDAWCVDWAREPVFAFPPWSMLSATCRHICALRRCDVVLVMHVARERPWWPDVVRVCAETSVEWVSMPQGAMRARSGHVPVRNVCDLWCLRLRRGRAFDKSGLVPYWTDRLPARRVCSSLSPLTVSERALVNRDRSPAQAERERSVAAAGSPPHPGPVNPRSAVFLHDGRRFDLVQWEMLPLGLRREYVAESLVRASGVASQRDALSE